MVELVDTLVLGASEIFVGVQVPLLSNRVREVAQRSTAPDLKSEVLQRDKGSNPFPSAKQIRQE